MNNRNRGKATERAIAKRVGGTRIGVMGGEDVMHPVYSIEVKSRVKFAGEKFLEQAERNCTKGKTPIALVHVHNKRFSEAVVMMRMRDFEKHNGLFIMYGEKNDE